MWYSTHCYSSLYKLVGLQTACYNPTLPGTAWWLAQLPIWDQVLRQYINAVIGKCRPIMRNHIYVKKYHRNSNTWVSEFKFGQPFFCTQTNSKNLTAKHYKLTCYC